MNGFVRKLNRSVLSAASLLPLILLGQGRETGAVGVCSHLMHKPSDAIYIKNDMAAQKYLGVKWLRTDSFWLHQEKKPGVFDWAHTDRIVENAEKEGISILWVTIGSQSSIPKFYLPLQKHLPELDRYFRALATRYKGRCRYYEISNEVDGGSPLVTLGDTKNPAVYMELLKVVSKAIRESDPDAKIVSAGLAEKGVDLYPYHYMEKLLQLGLADYVDVIGIHPYSNSHTPEFYYPGRVAALKQLLKKYHAENKPIWGTEMGEPAGRSIGWDKFFQAAFKTAKIDPSKRILAVVRDEKHNFQSEMLPLNRYTMGVKFAGVEEIKVADVAKLPADRILLYTPSGLTVTGLPEALRDFLKRGGCIIMPAGLPLYSYHQYADGMPSGFIDCGDKYMKMLHVGWDSFWTKRGEVPVNLTNLKGPGFDGLSMNGRICSAKNLQPGDRFIPLVTSEYKGKELPAAGVFLFNSELKGCVIMATPHFHAAWSLPMDVYAKTLPRMLMLLQASGVERSFIYRVRAFDFETTWSFGITSFYPDSRPLPPGAALMTMLKAMPDGSRLSLVRRHNPVIVRAERPDGKTAWAVWNEFGSREYDFAVTGKVATAYGHWGERLPFGNGKVKITDAPLYVIGPKEVALVSAAGR